MLLEKTHQLVPGAIRFLFTDVAGARRHSACSMCSCSSHKLLFIAKLTPATRFLTTSSVWYKRRKDAATVVDTAAKLSTKEKRTNVVPIWKNMTVQELAESLGKPIDTVFEAMIYVKDTNAYDSNYSCIDNLRVIQEIVKKCGLRSMISSPQNKQKHEEPVEDLDVKPLPINKAHLKPREPVVTIMGHVDHGKTTLLDTLRNSNVAAGEAGGITQHIGAFRVPVGNRHITFLDTPGHAAFSAMRNRGAQATDIVVLVVAADDGVMEQTKESISMAREANVPIIVAINKIDKGNADIDGTKSMLLQEGIQLEDFGGDVQSVAISALKGTNIPQLLDTILLQAELLNLQSEIMGKVEGVVLESRVDYDRGKLSTALVQRGVLRKSAFLVAGTAWAKVRGIFNEHGEPLQEAGPSIPVEVIGWRELPSAGDKIYEVDSEARAKRVMDYRISQQTSQKQEHDYIAISAKNEEHLKNYRTKLAEKRRLHRHRLRKQGPRGKEILEDSDPTPKLHLVVKGDVDGSVESFLDLLESYDCSSQCRLDIVHYGVGDITETDVKLADAFGAHIYAFNVSLPEKLRGDVNQSGIKYRESRVIYRLVEDLKKDIESILPPKDVDEELGTAAVLQIFYVNDGKKKVPVAGSRCTKGILRKDSLFKLLRGENEVVFDGKVGSIRHLKNEVDSIKNGVECGIALSDLSIDPLPGDSIICYRKIQLPQKTEWDPGF